MNVSAGLVPFNTILSDDLHGRRCSWTSLGSTTESSFGPYTTPSHDHIDQRQRRHSISAHAYRTRAGSACLLLPGAYLFPRPDNKGKSDLELSDVSSKPRIRINVRGKKYETYQSTLEQFPDTLLGSPGGRYRFYDSVNEELCFNRDPNSFDAILFFYQSGGSILARPSSVEEDLFADEVKFFGLFEEAEEIMESLASVQEETFTGRLVNLRRKMWNLFERPAECRFGRTFARISLIVILLSVIAFCLETVPEFQRPPLEKTLLPANDSNLVETAPQRNLEILIENKSDLLIKQQMNQNLSSHAMNNSVRLKSILRNTTMPKQDPSTMDPDQHPKKWKFWFYLDTVFVVFFTAEYIARVFSSPDRLKYIRSFLSIVDFCAIAPYYISHIAQAGKLYNIKSFNVIRSIRLFRVVRLFKLSRYSSGLKLLGRALYLSRWKMLSLIGCIVMATVFYSGLMYYIEGFEAISRFESIPHTFWWSIITMSTVGYGDVVPTTNAGKLVGACCALTGIVLLFILPIPSFVTDFSKLYERWLRRRRRNKHKDESKVMKTQVTWARKCSYDL